MMKHNEDDGDLSVFAGTKGLIFVCEKGHFWILDATQQSKSDDGVGTTEQDILTIESDFGVGAANFLRPD